MINSIDLKYTYSLTLNYGGADRKIVGVQAKVDGPGLAEGYPGWKWTPATGFIDGDLAIDIPSQIIREIAHACALYYAKNVG